MQCRYCGENLEPSAKFCPNCGKPVQIESLFAEATPSTSEPSADQGAAQEPAAGPVPAPAPEAKTQAPVPTFAAAYIRADYNPAINGRPISGAGQPAQPAAAAAGTQPGPAGQPAVQRFSSPAPAGTIVFSIINMLCCGFFVSTIVGIVALVFAIISTSEPNREEAARKVRTANMLNWIGLGFVILEVLAVIIFILASLFYYRNNNTFFYD
jgi:hypothetical protein